MSLEQLRLQRLRRLAYDNGDYELDEWEGFECPDCGWRGLSAPGEFESDRLVNYCDECDSESVETRDGETDWDRVSQKIPEEYHSGEAQETNLDECAYCNRDIPGDVEPSTITINGESLDLHERCADNLLEYDIENNEWFDTFTDEHYEAAAEYLETFESIGCVVTSEFARACGEIFIHTNHANTNLVRDVIDMYSGRIHSARVAHEESEGEFECVNEHGTCFEILIDFCTDEPTTVPPDEISKYSHEWGDDKLTSQDYFYREYPDKPRYQPNFDADFSEE